MNSRMKPSIRLTPSSKTHGQRSALGRGWDQRSAEVKKLLLGSDVGTSRDGQSDIYSYIHRGYYSPLIGLNPVEWETLY
jgi:hypothetical protein